MRLAWLTDLHLNFVARRTLKRFIEEVAALKPDAVLLGGDVGEAGTVAGFLETLARAWQVPIYFVLGNHDFYHGSIRQVHADIAALTRRVPALLYLSAGCTAWSRAAEGTGRAGSTFGHPVAPKLVGGHRASRASHLLDPRAAVARGHLARRQDLGRPLAAVVCVPGHRGGTARNDGSSSRQADARALRAHPQRWAVPGAAKLAGAHRRF